jgi:hypothetical protein
MSRTADMDDSAGDATSSITVSGRRCTVMDPGASSLSGWTPVLRTSASRSKGTSAAASSAWSRCCVTAETLLAWDMCATCRMACAMLEPGLLCLWASGSACGSELGEQEEALLKGLRSRAQSAAAFTAARRARSAFSCACRSASCCATAAWAVARSRSACCARATWTDTARSSTMVLAARVGGLGVPDC